MIDSVLKGTGNSRFLKSAVPAGTSWADALAMLQAGTFPIDFNGINTEGFQQVGTPLNKANLLKDVNALTLGLSGTAVPDDMFNVLAHAGELHVWRKTARDANVSAPGYNLGDIKSLTDICQAPSGYQGYFGVKAEYSDEVTVNNLGVISLVSPSEIELGFTGETAVFLPEGADNTLKNKFLKIVSVLAEQPNAKILDSYKDAVIHCESNFYCDGYGNSSPGYNIYFKNFRLVTPYPAGLPTTYPVSTNPNAYQEGDDAKPAGYTLGEVVTGSFRVSYASNSTGALYGYCDSVTVDDNGVIHGKDTSSTYVNASSSDSLTTANLFKGKFIYLGNAYGITGIPFVQGTLYYIPTDAVFTRINGNEVLVDRYQPVTGYAAIPAGTTIEYLGKLGDKTMVIIGSYIGTGVCGAENPTKIKTGFPPKLVAVHGVGNTGGTSVILLFRDLTYAQSFVGSSLDLNFANITWLSDGVKWYSNEVLMQGNQQGTTYKYIVIG